jgi:hypothetical protein
MTAPRLKNVTAKSVRGPIPRAPTTLRKWISRLSGRHRSQIHYDDRAHLGAGREVGLWAATSGDPMIAGRTSAGRTRAQQKNEPAGPEKAGTGATQLRIFERYQKDDRNADLA